MAKFLLRLSLVLALAAGCLRCGGGGDATGSDPGFPGPSATCDEMVAFLNEYAAAHGECTADPQCVPAIVLNVGICSATWLESVPSGVIGDVVAVRADAATPEFREFSARVSACCAPYRQGGSGWSCMGVADAPFVYLESRCASGRCTAHVVTSPESCIPFWDADADADADVDADGEIDADADGDTGAATDEDAGAETDAADEPFSFAVLTDLHVGEGVPDYGDPGHDDSGGVETDVTLRLRTDVAKINMAAAGYGIAFVMVLGDVTDSAERSEMLKCKQILDQLEVPWFPLIGNHDMWPYATTSQASGPVGDAVFEEVFGPQLDVVAELFDGFERAPTPVFNPERGVMSRFINYAFDFRGYHFVALDLSTREHAPLGYPGVGAEADLHDFDGGTWRWLDGHMAGYGGLGDHNVFFFSHHPPVVTSLGLDSLSLGERSRIATWIRDGGYGPSLWGWFAGHHHVDYELTDFEGQRIVVVGAAKDGVVRVVRVSPDGTVDPAIPL